MMTILSKIKKISKNQICLNKVTNVVKEKP